MKVKFLSDLHLEFSHFPIADVEKELGPDSEKYLLVAGDTVLTVALKEKRTDSDARKMQKSFDKFIDAAQGFKQVYLIPGNHEAYSFGDVATNSEVVNDYLARKGYNNIRMLENERVSLTDKTDMLACTLWTSMKERDPTIMYLVQRGMNDFYVSNYKGGAFTTADAADKFYESKQWMQDQLMDGTKSFVVMTHHLPTFLGIDPHFKGMDLNYGYASSMEDFIFVNPNITHWIHGHTHYDTDFLIGHTQILSKQRGYPPNVWGNDRKGGWNNFTAAEFEIA